LTTAYAIDNRSSPRSQRMLKGSCGNRRQNLNLRSIVILNAA
jgi:hypothetical protein